MLYQSVYNLVKNAIQSLPYDVEVSHGRRAELNTYINDNGKLPLAWVFPMVGGGEFPLEGYNRLFASYTVAIAFNIEVEPDYSNLQELETISYSDLIATRFLTSMKYITADLGNAVSDIEISNIRKEPFFKDSAHVCSGTFLSFQIVVPDDFNYCC